MPTLLNYYGIKVSMNFIQSEHEPAHIHAEYGEYHILVDLDTLATKGNFPLTQQNLVIDWVKNNQELLKEIWTTQNFNLIQNNQNTSLKA